MTERQAVILRETYPVCVGGSSSSIKSHAMHAFWRCTGSSGLGSVPPHLIIHGKRPLHREKLQRPASSTIEGMRPFQTNQCGVHVGPQTSRVHTQCFAKCPFTCQFDRLSDQLCQSLDRLSDHFAKHCAHLVPRPLRPELK